MTSIRVAVAALILSAGLACHAAEFYVSPDGNDGNPGTKDRPFASPVAARDAVRKCVAAGLKENVKVLLKGGTYYLPEGLALGPQDSGTEKFSITYTSQGDAPAVLVGGARVTGFKQYKGNIYVAPIPKGAKPLVASENGVRLTLARSPNEGWHSGGRAAGAGRFNYGGAFAELKGGDVSDAIASVWTDANWFNPIFPVKSIDVQGRLVVMEGSFAMPKRNRFCLMNILDLLDQSGECQISAKEGKLYVWPRKTPIESQTYAVATADYVISVTGTDGKTVRNLHFENLDLTMANKDIVYFTAAEGCSIRACRIENAWERGVHVRGPAQKITVADSEIRHVGFNGVELKGLPFGGPYVNKGHLIENNHIHHCGVIIGHSAGVRIEDSGDSRVLHNHIHHSPRYGTSVKSLTPKFMSNPEHKKDRYKYLHSRNNVLAYNHIHHVCLDSEDTGAMQSWGPGRDNVYDHNLIHDVGAPHILLSSGIYMDDQTDYFTVTNNIIYNIYGRGHVQVIYAKGIDNKLDNNVLIANRNCGAAMRTKASGVAYGHRYTHNIIVMENPSAGIYQFDDGDRNRVVECENNVYFKPSGGLRIAGRSPYGKSLEEWRRTFDKNSLTVDPLFVDPAKHDYRLKPNSPALKLGIKSIDASGIGLTDKFPRRLDRE